MGMSSREMVCLFPMREERGKEGRVGVEAEGEERISTVFFLGGGVEKLERERERERMRKRE